VNKFLAMLALTTGRLKQGGSPDLEASAKQVMRDWNNAKIPYFTPVPEIHPSMMPSDAPGAEGVGDMKVVEGWKPAFDLAGLFVGADEAAWGEEPTGEDEQMVENG
jgi:nuclear GTP-binding protein